MRPPPPPGMVRVAGMLPTTSPVLPAEMQLRNPTRNTRNALNVAHRAVNVASVAAASATAAAEDERRRLLQSGDIWLLPGSNGSSSGGGAGVGTVGAGGGGAGGSGGAHRSAPRMAPWPAVWDGKYRVVVGGGEREAKSAAGGGSGSGGGGEGAALLGVGHFGKTMKMENMIDSTTYAVKIIDMYQQHLRRLALRAAAAAAAAAGVSPSSAAGNYKGYSEMEEEEEGAAEVNVRVALRREARALGSVAHPRIVRCVG